VFGEEKKKKVGDFYGVYLPSTQHVYKGIGVQVRLGYPKGLFHLISSGPFHLNMLKLNNTFILKGFFLHKYIYC